MLEQSTSSHRTATEADRLALSCPCCGEHPAEGRLWNCNCGEAFDAFRVICGQGVVPTHCTNCGKFNSLIECPWCEAITPIEWWDPPTLARELERLQNANEILVPHEYSPPDPSQMDALRAARARVAMVAAKPLTEVRSPHPIAKNWADRLKSRRENL